MQLSGKTIFISGSSSGLGAACAQRFIERGANIIGLDRTSEPTWLHSWNTSQPWHSRYFHVQADVTDDTSVQLAVQSGIQRFGELSGLICCAGILHGERILGRDGIASLDAFRKVIEVNVIGTFNLVRYCAESMARNAPSSDDGERGVIIMTSSIASQDGQIGRAHV